MFQLEHAKLCIHLFYFFFVAGKQDLLQILLPQPLQLITSPLHFLGVSYVVATRKMASLELCSDSCACLEFVAKIIQNCFFFVDTVSLKVVSALFVRCFFLWTVMGSQPSYLFMGHKVIFYDEVCDFWMRPNTFVLLCTCMIMNKKYYRFHDHIYDICDTQL